MSLLANDKVSLIFSLAHTGDLDAPLVMDHLVKVIDPESALVSKAVKAPGKNKQLIREAMASDAFPT